MANKGRAIEISSQRDLEKEFANINKLFIGKETESNWEGRDGSVKKLRSILKSESALEYKESIVRGIHDSMSSLIKSIHSLRTSVALEGLSLVSDISCVLGDALDQYTMETVLSNLLKCSSVTKKLIVSKTAEVTNTFLSKTNFYTKMFVMLCKTTSEKNVQIRQLASIYIKTLLETHGSKENVRSTIEKAEIIILLNQFLKKGLVDAAPAIRDSCRSLYWTYQRLWTEQAERLCKSLDTTTQRQIEKSKSGITPKLAPKVLHSRSNSMSSLPSLLSRSSSSSSTSSITKRSVSPSPSLSSRNSSSAVTSVSTTSVSTKALPSISSTTTATPAFKKPALKRSHSAYAVPSKAPPRPIPATSSEVRRNLTVQKMSRLSHISNVSAPSASINHKINTIPPATTARRTQSEFHHQSVLASASLLHMLKSNDTQMKCKGIRLLSERLKPTPYNPSSLNTILPPDVPSKIDLLPILMDTLSKSDSDNEIYQTLMSWESLAGIFVYVMSVNYYCPTLIIANEEQRNSNDKSNEMTMLRLYSKGLLRVKMFLKRNDPELPYRLLSLLQSVMTDQKLLDASVKRDLQLFPLYKVYLQCGLLNWMDEILCDYIGIPEDEDAEMLMEGSTWLHVSKDDHSNIAGQWFDINAHVQSYVAFVLKALLNTNANSDNEMYQRLCHLAGHLKMANQRVFEKEMNGLQKEESSCVERALGLTAIDDDSSVENLDICSNDVDDITSEMPPTMDTDMIEVKSVPPNADSDLVEEKNVSNYSQFSSCGLTQEISTIVIKPQAMQIEAENSDIEKEEELSHNNKDRVVEDTPIAPNLPVAIHTPVSDYPSISNSATNVIERSTKDKFAHPAPIPRRISLEADLSLSHKKRRKTSPNVGSDERTLTILNFTRTKNESLFPRLQEISEAMPTKQQFNIQFWSQNHSDYSGSMLLFSLLDAISRLLLQTGDSIRSNAVTLIRKLLDNQQELLKFGDDSKSYDTLYYLIKALIKTNVDIYDEASVDADNAMEIILKRACSKRVALKALFRLLKDDEFALLEKDRSAHPLGAVYMYIAKLAPTTSYEILEKLLQKGITKDTLVKGVNHKNLGVRKSCMLATVKIHRVLGDPFINKYLSTLRGEQRQLLVIYLENEKKGNIRLTQ